MICITKLIKKLSINYKRKKITLMIIRKLIKKLQETRNIYKRKKNICTYRAENLQMLFFDALFERTAA